MSVSQSEGGCFRQLGVDVKKDLSPFVLILKEGILNSRVSEAERLRSWHLRIFGEKFFFT